jgi:secreted PhoX family phosphatase
VVTGPDAGISYELPYLGKFAWENAVAMPNSGDKTIVVGMDDGEGGQVYVYVGDKQATGNTVEKAGLTNGLLYGVQVTDVPKEDDATSLPDGGATFTLVPLNDVSGMTGAQLETASNLAEVTSFARPEDGSWDPSDPDNFYFATTANFRGISRVWKLSFGDIADVAAGGTATIAVQSPAYDASKSSAAQAGPRMMDNLTVNSRGQVIIQEDVGGQPYIGGVFQYEPANGKVERIAQHDPARFTPGTPGFLTLDEESSGIIPVPFLGAGKYLLDVQAHYGTGDPETVEGGQLLVVHIPPGKPVR